MRVHESRSVTGRRVDNEAVAVELYPALTKKRKLKGTVNGGVLSCKMSEKRGRLGPLPSIGALWIHHAPWSQPHRQVPHPFHKLQYIERYDMISSIIQVISYGFKLTVVMNFP